MPGSPRSNLKALESVALSSGATSGRALTARVRALLALAAAGKRSPVPREKLRAELKAIATSPQTSGRGLEAAASAAVALEHFDEDGDQALVWPSKTPAKRAGRSYWHPDGRFAAVDACQTQGERDRWREQIEGPPPWLKNPPASGPLDELAPRRRRPSRPAA